ncbi:hypothetical protein NQ315_005396, partial [Exocentrus adspersus]
GNLFSQQQNEDLIRLAVNPEGILFLAKTGGKTYDHKILGNFLNNKWHTVYLQYRSGNLTIEVDGETQVIANSSYRNELLISPGLYNEGAAVLLIGQQFNGCLLEGPSIVFHPKIISSNHNVVFETCPIPYDNCIPKEEIVSYDYCLTEPCMRHGTCLSGKKTYTCACLPRYTGKNCEIDLGNPCDRKPAVCKNSATCIPDAVGDFSCTCPPGFTGKLCDHELKLHPKCKSNMCSNGATCDVNPDTESIECHCKSGYSGPTCEIDTNECDPNPCLNGGYCTDEFNNFTCDCAQTGYKGRTCNVNINECISNPCLNQGTCFDTYGSYLCQCLPGFGGKDCQYNVDECSSQPCANKGICVGHSGGFECHCRPGFLGDYCEVEQGQQRQCDPSACPPNADCIDEDGVSKCICKPEFPGEFPNCNTDSMCAVNPCINGGTCTVLRSGYNCTCPPGLTGSRCQINIDECMSNPCLNGGTCIDRVNGFFCNCTDQWMGAICENPYDICELNPCKNNGSCISTNKHNFSCVCLPGFTGDNCEINIDDCKNNNCPPGQVCVDLVNDYECRCPPGYAGSDCTVDLDPCAKEPCHNGTCVSDPVNYQYSCNCSGTGYTGATCNEDIDECKIYSNTICNHGICVNSKGSFQCYCMPGYTGEHCNLDFDECLSMPCHNNASCVNLINNYECMCPPGYEGKDCSVNIDECDPIPCSVGSTCIDGINEFTCMCQPGLTGKLCDINIDDCESSPCLNGGRCIDGLNSYTCDCSSTGYEGLHCENNIDDCKGNPCKNGAYCEDLINDYDCDCFKGYTGKNCEIDIDECESNPCQFGGTCLERSNMTLYNPNILSQTDVVLPNSFKRPFNFSDSYGYECVCVPGVTGQNCEININECDSNPCHYGTCVDKIGGYICECEEGYEGEHCEIDIDECEKYRPCVNGTCIDKIATYFCSCSLGYGGKNCSVELIGCINNPCKNDGQCRPFLYNEIEHKFNCSCPNGFHGLTCETITTMSLSGNSLVIVNTSREEGYDIQFRFKTTLGDGLLALGKGLTYYILELSRGRLNLHSSLLNRWEGVFIGSNLNDSNWQKVFVAINSTHLVLSANDEQTIYPINYNENNNVTSTSFPVTYIGGTPSNLRKLTHGQPSLVGCTEDIMINGEWVVLPQSQMRTAPWLSFQNVNIGCLRKPQCDPNPCHSGGHCTDRWLDFSCTCERPYLGHTCQYNYTAATFGNEKTTNSLVTVEVADYARRAVRSIVDLSMFIRTRQPKGQIFYLGTGLFSSPQATSPRDTCICAQLESGELNVQIQFDGPSESYTVGGVKLDNGYNHLIEVIRNVTLVQVKLNGTEYFRKTISATGTLDAQKLILGGHPQTRIVRQTNENMAATKMDPSLPTAPASTTTILGSVPFKGIIQDVQISNGSSTMVVEFFPLEVPDVDIPPRFGLVSFDKGTILKGIVSDDTCRINPCNHNGVCENTWNDYRCICTRGFKGKDCNELEFCEIEGCPAGSLCNNLEDGYECISNVTFNGLQEPLHYNFMFSNSDDFIFKSLEVNYRTRSWGTVFFAKRDENYFVVFIYHNEVVVEFNFNGSTVTNRFRKDHFEGQWISLLFIFKEDVLKGGFRENVMDESSDFEVYSFDWFTFADIIKFGDIYVGGSDNKTFDYLTVIENADFNMTGYIPASDTTTVETFVSNSLENGGEYFSEDVSLYKVDRDKKSDKFKGCLGEVRINSLLLPYFPTKEIYHNQTYTLEYFELDSSSVVKHGCVLCYDTDCFNQGSCINSTETYKCNCKPGYTADDCSVDINECENNQCQNNASCVDMVAKYECECLMGYEGEYCEIDTDECLSNPCRHGGTCNDLIGTFKCECPDNFVGKQCEAPLLITCENKPCGEGAATCKTGPNEQTGNNFTCSCKEGMEGPLCDTAFCLRKHCEQGFCNTTGDVPYCQCNQGFEGKYCEVNIDECVSPTGGSPCQNGGVCKDGISRYDCDCNGTGYTGLLCEMDINECNENKMACGRDGTCENMPGTYRCICSIQGKCGHQCNLDDPCVVEHPCVHGICHSQCTDQPDYICSCEENYTGKNCTDLKVAASREDGGVNILYIIIPIVLILVIAFVIGMIVLVNIARSKRATRGTYSPSAQEFCNPRVELDHVLKPPPEERLI